MIFYIAQSHTVIITSRKATVDSKVGQIVFLINIYNRRADLIETQTEPKFVVFQILLENHPKAYGCNQPKGKKATLM